MFESEAVEEMSNRRFKDTISWQNKMVTNEIKVFFSKDFGASITVERLMPVQHSSHALFVFVLDNITPEYSIDYYEMPDARSYKNVSKHPKFTLNMSSLEFTRYLIFSNKTYLENVCNIIYNL